jgi:hypothetical protein
MDHLIAGAGVCLAQKVDDLVRARAADDPLRINVMHLANGGAQGGVIGAGVAVQLMDRARDRVFGLFRGAERILI